MKKSLLAIASIAAVACLLNVFAVYCSEKKGVETTAVSGAQQSDDIITFGSPISQPLAGKLGQIKIITPSNGKLAHAFAILRKPGSNTSSYLALHDMTDTNNRESTLTYLINKLKITSLDENEDTTRLVYDPQISPNGRYVLFKYGQPWLNGLYRIYVLDIISRSLNLASKVYLRYKFVSWSPDSRYIAFAEGGDNEGNTIGWPDSYIGPINLYVCDWKTKKSSLVASNDTIRGPFRWLVPHELVYGLLSQRGQDILNKPSENDGGKTLIKPANNSNLASEKKLQKEPRPDIYIFSRIKKI